MLVDSLPFISKLGFHKLWTVFNPSDRLITLPRWIELVSLICQCGSEEIRCYHNQCDLLAETTKKNRSWIVEEKQNYSLTGERNSEIRRSKMQVVVDFCLSLL